MNAEQRKQKIQKARTAKIPDGAGDLLALPSMEDTELSSFRHLSVNVNDAKIEHVS